MGKHGTKSGSASSTSSVDQEKKQPILRATLCLKNKNRVQEIEELEDCFILDFDPYSSESLKFSSLSISKHSDGDLPAISVIAERGQVACRVFPHSRHQCLKFPFGKTPHDKYCPLCYCYVCDIPAPCTEWSGHCHATDSYNSRWWYLRKKRRGQELDSYSDSEYQYQENSDQHISELSEESDWRIDSSIILPQWR